MKDLPLRMLYSSEKNNPLKLKGKVAEFGVVTPTLRVKTIAENGKLHYKMTLNAHFTYRHNDLMMRLDLWL